MERGIKSYIIHQSLFLIILFCINAHAAERPRIAVLNFSANNLDSDYGSAVRDLVEVELYRSEKFEILERRQIDIILKEQGFRAKDCDDTSCAVEAGKILSSSMIIIGSISKFDSYKITIKFIDINKSKLLHADSAEIKTAKKLNPVIKRLIRAASEKIFTRSTDDNDQWTSVTPDYYFRGIIPGWTQFAVGRHGKGALFTGTFVLSGSFSIWAYYDYRSKKDASLEAPLGTTEKKFGRLFNDYKKSVRIGKISLWVLASVYLLSWVDVIFFSAPGPPEKTARKNEVIDYFTVSLNIHGPGHKRREGISLEAGLRF